jgi:hypothetical protein
MTSNQKIVSRRTVVRLLLFMIGAALSLACTTAKQEEKFPANTSPASPAQTTASPLEKSDSSATASLAEVKAAVQRVYVNTVEIDASHSQPFIVGDFNADGSQDLAVIVKPANGALAKLNSEYANWIVEDPRKIVLPDTTKTVQKLPPPPAREMIRQNDLLLLVLHGYQQEGWRHPYARQTFLLKNSVGENIRRQSSRETSSKSSGSNSNATLPGDVISEKLAGHDGFLFWTSAKYAWHQ